jgi:hypothetical protein
LSDEDVIDVPSGAGNEPVMNRDDSVSDFAHDKRGESAFPAASFTPGCGGVALGHRVGDAGGVVAVLAPDVLHSLFFAASSFRGRGCAGRPWIRVGVWGSAGETSCFLRRGVPDRLGAW